jgi:DNA polymerase-3 subunit delta
VPAAFKPAYLVCGDDHGRIAERRAKLRALAEAESGVSGVEVLEGDLCTPDAVAGALSTMTFAMGRRFVVADGVERWKDADVEPVAKAMHAMDGETVTVAFFGREEGRHKVPDALREAVKAAGGAIAEESAVKPWELPRWLVAQARELDLNLDSAGARALVAQVGERQQRLLRELEKLAIEYEPGASIGAAEIEESSAPSAERKAWTLADALVAGDEKAATRALMDLRGQGERMPSLLYGIVRRLRDALAVAEALEAGQAPARVRKTLRMPSKAAERMIADVSRRDVESFRRALEVMADLELESRGGGAAGGALSEETGAVLALKAAAR